MKKVLILLALCALASATVPRKNQPATATATSGASSKTSGDSSKTYCPPDTPCGWSYYKSHNQLVESFVKNSECICSSDTECLIMSEDYSTNSFVHQCRPGTVNDLS